MLNLSVDTSNFGGRRSPGATAMLSSLEDGVSVGVLESSCGGFDSTEPESSEYNSSSPGSSTMSSVTCTCATPPKKSVIRVSLSGRLKRFVRMPLCDRMATGSYMLNYECTLRSTKQVVHKDSCTYKVLHCGLASLIDSFEVFEDKVGVAVDNSNTNFIVILVLGMQVVQ